MAINLSGGLEKAGELLKNKYFQAITLAGIAIVGVIGNSISPAFAGPKDAKAEATESRVEQSIKFIKGPNGEYILQTQPSKEVLQQIIEIEKNNNKGKSFKVTVKIEGGNSYTARFIGDGKGNVDPKFSAVKSVNTFIRALTQTPKVVNTPTTTTTNATGGSIESVVNSAGKQSLAQVESYKKQLQSNVAILNRLSEIDAKKSQAIVIDGKKVVLTPAQIAEIKGASDAKLQMARLYRIIDDSQKIQASAAVATVATVTAPEKTATQPESKKVTLQIKEISGKKVIVGVDESVKPFAVEVKNQKIQKATKFILNINGTNYDAGFIVNKGDNAQLAFTLDGKTWVQFTGLDNTSIKLANGRSMNFGELQKGFKYKSAIEHITSIVSEKVVEEAVEIGQIVLAPKLEKVPKAVTHFSALQTLKANPTAFKQLVQAVKAGEQLKYLEGVVSGDSEYNSISIKNLQSLLLSIKGQTLTKDSIQSLTSNEIDALIGLVALSEKINNDGVITNGSLYGVSANNVIGFSGSIGNVPSYLKYRTIAANTLSTIEGDKETVSQLGVEGKFGLPKVFDRFFEEKGGVIIDANLRATILNAYQTAYNNYKANPANGLNISYEIETPGGNKVSINSSVSQIELESAIKLASEAANKGGAITFKSLSSANQFVAVLKRALQSDLDLISPMSIGRDGISAKRKYTPIEYGNFKLQKRILEVMIQAENQQMAAIGLDSKNTTKKYSNVEIIANQRKLPQGLLSIVSTLTAFKSGIIGLNVSYGQKSEVVMVEVKTENGKTEVIEVPYDRDMFSLKSENGKSSSGTPWTATEMSQALSALFHGVPVPGIGYNQKATWSNDVKVSGLQVSMVDELGVNINQVRMNVAANYAANVLNSSDSKNEVLSQRDLPASEAIINKIVAKASSQVKELTNLARQKESRGETLTSQEQMLLEQSQITLNVIAVAPEGFIGTIRKGGALGSRLFARFDQESAQKPLFDNVTFAQVDQTLNTQGIGQAIAHLGKTQAQKDLIQKYYAAREAAYKNGTNLSSAQYQSFIDQANKVGIKTTVLSDKEAAELMVANKAFFTVTYGSSGGRNLELTNLPLKGFKGKIIKMVHSDGVISYSLSDASGILECPQPHILTAADVANYAVAKQVCAEGARCVVNVDAIKASIATEVNPDSSARVAAALHGVWANSTDRGSEVAIGNIEATASQVTQLEQALATKYFAEMAEANRKGEVFMEGNTIEIEAQMLANLKKNGAKFRVNTYALLNFVKEGRNLGISLGKGGIGIQFGQEFSIKSLLKQNQNLLGFTYVKDAQGNLVPCISTVRSISSGRALSETTEISVAISFKPLPEKKKTEPEKPKPEQKVVRGDGQKLDRADAASTQSANANAGPDAPTNPTGQAAPQSTTPGTIESGGAGTGMPNSSTTTVGEGVLNSNGPASATPVVNGAGPNGATMTTTPVTATPGNVPPSTINQGTSAPSAVTAPANPAAVPPATQGSVIPNVSNGNVSTTIANPVTSPNVATPSLVTPPPAITPPVVAPVPPVVPPVPAPAAPVSINQVPEAFRSTTSTGVNIERAGQTFGTGTTPKL